MLKLATTALLALIVFVAAPALAQDEPNDAQAGISADQLGAALTQLTFDYEGGYPDWSPDGAYIVFTSEWNEETRVEGNLWRLPAGGGERVQLTAGGGHHGVVSPDGRYIAYDALEGSQVRLVPAGGGVPVRIVPESIPIVHSANPCWSPDGTRIAFRTENDIYVLDLPTGEFTPLWHCDDAYPMPIDWAESGEFLVAAFNNVEARESTLWKVFIDGSEPVQLTCDCHCTQGTLSPDGKYLLYSATIDGSDYDLWVVPTAGGEPLQLTGDGYWDIEPCWSPAGDRLVFRTSRADRFDLWIMELDMAWIKQGLAELNGSA